MGVFGNKNINFCPLCGDRIGAMGGQPLVDGAVCAACWQKFRSKSQADMSQLTIEQVGDIIDGTFEQEITGQPCPVCGKPMDGSARAIADAVICSACERMERTAYFITDEGDELDDLELRFVKEDYNIVTTRLQDALNSAPPDAISVAYTDESFTDINKTVVLIGVAKGEFSTGDEVVLVHGGEAVNSTIRDIHGCNGVDYDVYKDEPDTGTIATSDFGWLAFKDIEAVFAPGDYIYKR